MGVNLRSGRVGAVGPIAVLDTRIGHPTVLVDPVGVVGRADQVHIVAVASAPAQRQRVRTTDLLQPLVDLRIDTADKERRHTADRTEITTAPGKGFQAV
jgi:hypothetical protein